MGSQESGIGSRESVADGLEMSSIACIFGKRFLLKKSIFLLLIAISLRLIAFSQYWQQQVNYKIDVSLNDQNNTIKGFISHICLQTKNMMLLFTKYLTIGKNDQKILNKNGTFIRAIMSYVNILVSTPSPASIPLPTVVSSLATAKKHSLHIKGGGASIQLR